MNHKECRQLFVEALYGELAPQQKGQFQAHIDSCPDCRTMYEDLRSVATTMSRRTVPMPTRAEWTSFWNTLEASLRTPKERRRPSLVDVLARVVRVRPAWTYSLAAVTLIAFGVTIGLLMSRMPASPGLESELSSAQRILLNEKALNYLERSKVLLLGIVNGGQTLAAAGGLQKEQEMSRMLVSEAAALRNELTDADHRRMVQLINDLEVVLLQIANLEEQKDFPALEIVRNGVERRGILLKINLEQMRPQETPPTQGITGKSQPGSSI